MKLLRFSYNGKIHLGVMINNEVCFLKNYELSKNFDDMIDFIKNHTDSDLEKLKNEQGEHLNIDEISFLSPFERTAHDVLCVGLNYRKHVDEAVSKLNTDEAMFATYFSKRAEKISHNNSSIFLDDNLDSSMDYETELAVVIGKEGKDIEVDDALDYIFGFTIVNDFSSRNLQKNHGQWFKGKSLDGYTSMGPYIVTKDEFDYPLKLNLSTKINGELRQNSNTKYMIRDINKLVSELSHGLTLVAGDIIATGTPEGVGMGFNPPKYLKKGDKVESFVEGIGSLVNYIE